MKIPFVDLQAQYQGIKKEMDVAIASILDNTSFIMGKPVEEFEKEFASFLDVKHCVSVSSGTSALYLALRALGIGEGDEVILPSHTFIGSVEPITLLGAVPVFVDVKDYVISVSDVKDKITDKTKAIIPVHLYGQSCDMDSIMEIAKEHGLKVIEDACQAHGGEYKGKKLGTIGDAGCFSFYPGKNLGGYGDGGAVVTNNESLATEMRQFLDHGREKGEKYVHATLGFNFRMDALQAKVLSVKLKHLADWITQRQKNAEMYDKKLSKLKGVKVPPEGVYHLYVIQHPDRDGLREHLAEKGISTGIHYPVPLHLQPACKEFGGKKGDFPDTEKIVDTILSLPMYPELTEEQIDYICKAIEEF
jgi:dTDP-4-amino-4,6-dideoxygalactose transaminase